MRFGTVPSGPWPKAPERAIILPLIQAGQGRPMELFVAGLNPFLRFDEAYHSFANLFVGQLAAGLSNARAYDAERKRAEALAEIDQAKTTFFSNVSHEFRTPLTSAWQFFARVWRSASVAAQVNPRECQVHSEV